MKIPNWAAPVLLGALLASQAWVVKSIIEVKEAVAELRGASRLSIAKNP